MHENITLQGKKRKKKEIYHNQYDHIQKCGHVRSYTLT